jgi:pyruvate formate lyase activating enzyme
LNKSDTIVKKRMVIDISRMTIHNGPGIRTLILFKGCPLRCIWCSTPESQKETSEIVLYPERCIFCGDCLPVCPNGAITIIDKKIAIERSLCNNCGNCASVCYAEALRLLGRPYTVEELMDVIKRDAVAYKHSSGGVTVSGGEPFQRPEFLVELFQELKKNNINICVDTCGFTSRANIDAALPYVDSFLWDVKHMDDAAHKELTGVSNRLILNNLRFVSDRGIPVYLRLPVIPVYNDSEENIRAVCLFAKDLPSLVEIDLLPLHHLGRARYVSLGREYPIEGMSLIPDERLYQMKGFVESFGLKCNIIG